MRSPLGLLLCLLCAASATAPAMEPTIASSPVDQGLGDLAAIRAAEAAIRDKTGINQERDAGPELTPLKQALRAWMERRIAGLSQEGEVGPLAARLNAELVAADLTCESMTNTRRCAGGVTSDDDGRGYVGGVGMERLDYGRYLLVTTQVGIRCGTDQSAYLYERKQNRWSLLLASEQDDYAPGRYAPQNLLSVHVSPANAAFNKPAPPPFVLTLGYSPWCQSNWQMLYTRLFHASERISAARPLIDTADTLYMGDWAIADGTVTARDAVIQFEGQSIDSGVLVRPVVRHYAIGPGDSVRRIGPIAFDPSAFVDEWLSGDWDHVASWTDRAASAAAIRRWHGRLHEDLPLGEYDGDALRCRDDRSLWQVAFVKNNAERYYLVRWEPPYRFSMVGISTRRRRGCDIADPMPDNLATLYATDGWRR